jgi:phage-related protein
LTAYIRSCIVAVDRQTSAKRIKPVEFLGSALEDLRAFPRPARRSAGYQIDRVQRGLEPDDWKPMATVGAGVREIRLRDEAGAFRVVYAAKLEEAVYVLHCFQKKSKRTARRDLELATSRYRAIPKGEKRDSR